MRRVLADRDARLLLGGQAVSLFGDSAMFLALGIWTKALTGSNAAAGLVFFVFAVPLLAAPLAGLLVDRVRRRRVLMAEHAALAAVVLLLLLVRDEGDVWLLYAVTFLYGLGSTIGQAARPALMKVMLPDELLADANGLLQTAAQGFRLVAPLLGAGIFAAVGGGPVAVLDAATFAVSVGTLALLRVHEPEPEPSEHHFFAEVSAGARHIWRTLPLRQLVGAVAAALVVVGFVETAIFAVVDEGLGRPPAFLGVLEVFQGIGAIAGGLLAGRVVRRLGDGTVAGAGLVLFAVGDLLFVSHRMAVVMAGYTIAGWGIAWAIVGFITALQRRSPVHLQGRVTSTATMAFSVPQTFSIALGAVLVTLVDYRLLLVVMAVATAASGAYLLTRRTFREQAVGAAEPLIVRDG
jgi:MFS family permease